MQILSDNDYKIFNSFQTEMQTSCNFKYYYCIKYIPLPSTEIWACFLRCTQI